MKIALISDIHANFEALSSTLDMISTQDVDRIVCLGDIVGYNANPTECIALLRQRDVICVAGNHDRAVTGHITTHEFPYAARRAVTWTRGRLDDEDIAYLAALPVELSFSREFVAVHGALHPENGKEIVRLDDDGSRRLSLEALIAHPSKARVCAFGHTHRLGVFELRDGVLRELKGDRIRMRDDGWYLVNPGTVGKPRPRDRRADPVNQKATYVVLDLAEKAITTHRVDYDSRAAFAKTRHAGLIPFWFNFPEPMRLSLMRLPKPVRIALLRAAEMLQR